MSQEQLWRYEDALLSSIQVNPPAAATTHDQSETPEGDMLGADWESSSAPTERDLTYLTRRRRQGSACLWGGIVSPPLSTCWC